MWSGQIGFPDERSSSRCCSHGLLLLPNTSTRCLHPMLRRSPIVAPSTRPRGCPAVGASGRTGCCRRPNGSARLSADRGGTGWWTNGHTGFTEFMEWISQERDWDGDHAIRKVRVRKCAVLLIFMWHMSLDQVFHFCACNCFLDSLFQRNPGGCFRLLKCA